MFFARVAKASCCSVSWQHALNTGAMFFASGRSISGIAPAARLP